MQCLLSITLCGALALTGCHSSNRPAGSSGSGNHNVTKTIQAHLPFVNGTVPFVLYFEQPETGSSGSSGSAGATLDRFRCDMVRQFSSNQRLEMKYDAGSFQIDGRTYDLSKGQVFFWSRGNVRQIDVLLPPINRVYSPAIGDAYIRELSATPAVREVLAAMAGPAAATQAEN